MDYDVTYEEVSWKQHQLDVKNGARDIAAGAWSWRRWLWHYGMPRERNQDYDTKTIATPLPDISLFIGNLAFWRQRSPIFLTYSAWHDNDVALRDRFPEMVLHPGNNPRDLADGLVLGETQRDLDVGDVAGPARAYRNQLVVVVKESGQRSVDLHLHRLGERAVKEVR